MKKIVATLLVVAMIIPVTGCGLAKRVLNHFMPKQGILSATPEPYQLNPYADFSNIDGAKTIYNDDGTVTVIVNGEAITYSMDENGSYSVIYMGTPAPTTVPTDASKPDPTPVPTNVKVVDALNYTKKIVAYLEYEHVPDPAQPDIGNHTIVIPKIVDDSAVAKSINDRVYKNVENIYNALLNNREDSEIYRADYFYTNYNGIIGISQRIFMGGQFQGGGDFFHYFYYDSVNKKELTFDEYLSLLGVSHSDFSKLKNDDGTPVYSDWLPNITNGVFDTNGGQFYILFPDSPEGGMAFKTSTNLFQ